MATTNPLFVGQGYLGTAPQGVGVQAIWARGPDGSNSRFVDLEQGCCATTTCRRESRCWPDLTRCAVLGEMVALDNTAGTAGMAPGPQARVISYFEQENIAQPACAARVASRIALAVRSLRFGDVLQLEL